MKPGNNRPLPTNTPRDAYSSVLFPAQVLKPSTHQQTLSLCGTYLTALQHWRQLHLTFKQHSGHCSKQAPQSPPRGCTQSQQAIQCDSLGPALMDSHQRSISKQSVTWLTLKHFTVSTINGLVLEWRQQYQNILKHPSSPTCAIHLICVESQVMSCWLEYKPHSNVSDYLVSVFATYPSNHHSQCCGR